VTEDATSLTERNQLDLSCEVDFSQILSLRFPPVTSRNGSPTMTSPLERDCGWALLGLALDGGDDRRHRRQDHKQSWRVLLARCRVMYATLRQQRDGPAGRRVGGDCGRTALHLDGPARGSDARALREGLDSMLTLINSVIDAEDEPTPRLWLLAELSLSSVNCAVIPPPEFEAGGRVRLDNVWAGLEHLARSLGIPPGWSEQAVWALVGLVDLRKFEGVDGGYLGRDGDRRIRLDTRLRENAEGSVGAARESLGEVQGQIIRYVNDGKKKEVGVRDISAGRSIKVSFPDHLDDKILEALRSHSTVTIWGTLRRNSQGQKISLSAEDVNILEVPRPGETVEAITGALGRDWTGGLSSVDWVRRQRGE